MTQTKSQEKAGAPAPAATPVKGSIRRRVAWRISLLVAVSIQITNRGAVPVERRKDFFQKYTTQGKKKGTGLGTYSAKLIADTRGYGLMLDTSDKENATTITVKVPS